MGGEPGVQTLVAAQLGVERVAEGVAEEVEA